MEKDNIHNIHNIHNTNNENNINKNKLNLVERLFDVIYLPLFLYLGLTLIVQVISREAFYFEHIFLYGIGVFILGVYFQGLGGYNAAKDKTANIKPWLAGLSIALIVSIFSLILNIVAMVYFPNPMMNDLISTSMNEEVMIGENDDEFVDVDNSEELVYDEDINGVENGVDLGIQDSSDFSSMLIWMTLVSGLVGILFSALFGALFGFIGGAIGKD